MGDITSETIAERNQQEYERMVYHIPLGLLIFQIEDTQEDKILRLIAANPSSETLTGISFRSFLGQALTDVLPDLQQDFVQLLIKSVHANHFEKLDDFSFGESQMTDVSLRLTIFPLPRDRLGISLEDVSDLLGQTAALEQSVALLKTTLESTSDGILVVDCEGLIEKHNSMFMRMWDIPESIVASRSEKQLWEYASEQLDYPQAFRTTVAELDAQPDVEREGLLEFTDGRTFKYHSGPRQSRGNTLGRVWTFNDVSTHAAMERTIKQQMRHLKALQAIDRAIAGSSDLSVTLDVFLDQVTTQLHIDAADVLLLNKASQEIEFAAARGFWTSIVEKTKRRVGEGIAGRSVLLQQPVTVPDLRTELNFQRGDLVNEEQFVFYRGLPLVAKGEVRGLLELFHRKRLDPTEEWSDFARTLAGQGAIAIESGELLAKLQDSYAELTMAYDATIEALARALDLRNEDTADHSRRVTELTIQVARAMGIPSEELPHIRRGALLHDVGKIGIADAILLKPGKLTDEEWEAMRQHPERAHTLLAPIPYLKPALDIPLCHHEKWDGSGYPKGLKGEEIPLVARIFAVVDVWDALTSRRPYREAWPRQKVKEHMRELSGSHFDPRVVEIFLNTIDE